MSSKEQENGSNDKLVYPLLFAAAVMGTSVAIVCRYHIFGTDSSEAIYWKALFVAIISVFGLIGKLISDLITPDS